MNGLSLCSGIGGLDLGVKLAVTQYRTICYVEIEAYPQDILLARMADGVLDRAPIWGDLKRFDATALRGLVDIVHGGYPCQPASRAGRRSQDNWLWLDVARVVSECDPEWCFFENVPPLVHHGLGAVLGDLHDMGFDAEWGIFSAQEVGAPHRRERLYLLAHSMRERDRIPQGEVQARWDEPEHGTRWASEPTVGRVADGLPHRVDRLKALGNGVVPEVAALAWRTLHAELS